MAFVAVGLGFLHLLQVFDKQGIFTAITLPCCEPGAVHLPTVHANNFRASQMHWGHLWPEKRQPCFLIDLN